MEARRNVPPFALAPGGPIDRLQEKLRFRHHERPNTLRRAIVFALVTWLPLAVAAVLSPTAGADIPFFHDIAVHARFLVIVPLLVLAEAPIGMRSRMVALQFLESGLVPDAEAGEYEDAMRRGRRLLDSFVIEMLLLALSAAMVWLAVRGIMHEPSVYWFERVTPAGITLSPAGWWCFAVASPLFAFLLLRWLWRYLVWWWFLGRTARLNLRLTGTHPDRMGGLGFVAYHHTAFCMVTFAVGCAVSAAAAIRILNGHATLRSYQNPIIVIALLSILFGIAPLLVYTPRLLATKRTNWMRYTRLASDYVWRFEQKWMGKEPSEELLGTSDIQSLADIGGSFQRMVDMRVFAIDRRLIFSYLIAAVAPMAPLLLTMMPLRDILKFLFNTLI